MFPKYFIKTCYKKKKKSNFEGTPVLEVLSCYSLRWRPDWAVSGWLWVGRFFWSRCHRYRRAPIQWYIFFCANKHLLVKFKQSFLWHVYFFKKIYRELPSMEMPCSFLNLREVHLHTSHPRSMHPFIHQLYPDPLSIPFQLLERLKKNEIGEAKLFTQLHPVNELETGRNS